MIRDGESGSQEAADNGGIDRGSWTFVVRGITAMEDGVLENVAVFESEWMDPQFGVGNGESGGVVNAIE